MVECTRRQALAMRMASLLLRERPGGRLTRAQCTALLADHGIGTAGQLGYHLLWYASQRGVLCIAPNIGAEQTFVLLDEWVPDPCRPDREEALATIALRYFRSHGPSTRQDFAGWTGLTAADARRGIAGAGDQLAMVRVDGTEMYLNPAALDNLPPPASRTGQVLVLPGFDEYLLGYKDRSLMLAEEHQQAIIPGGNGVFQATLVRDGMVIGTWKRTISRTGVRIAVQPLPQLGDRSWVAERKTSRGELVQDGSECKDIAARVATYSKRLLGSHVHPIADRRSELLGEQVGIMAVLGESEID